MIGAAVVRSTSNESEHVWEAIVTDGREWHYIRVLGSACSDGFRISLLKRSSRESSASQARCQHRIESTTSSTLTRST